MASTILINEDQHRGAANGQNPHRSGPASADIGHLGNQAPAGRCLLWAWILGGKKMLLIVVARRRF
jgi:hypothetical protein